MTGEIVVVSLGPELDMGSVMGRRKTAVLMNQQEIYKQIHTHTRHFHSSHYYGNRIHKQIPMVVMLETYTYMAHSTVHIDHLKRIKPIPVMTVMISLASDTTSPTTARMMNLLLELGVSGIRRTVTLEVAMP